MESWLAWLELLLLAVLRGRSCDFQGLVAFFFFRSCAASVLGLKRSASEPLRAISHDSGREP